MAIDFRADPTPPRTKGWVPRGQGQVKLVPGWEPRPEYGAGQIGDPFDPQGGDPESYPAPPDLPPSISPSTPPPLPSVPKPTPQVYTPTQTQALSSPTPSPAPAASTTGAPSPPRSAVAGTPPTRTPSQQSFLDEMVPTAKKVSADTGIPWQVLVAIPANETGWGTAVFHNNYFGIKDPKGQAAKTWEVIDGQRQDITDRFASFDGPEQSMRGFNQFLHDNPRYKPALDYLQKNPSDWPQFVKMLNQEGYATDPQWADKVTRIGQPLESSATQSPRSMSPGDQLPSAQRNTGNLLTTAQSAIGSKYVWGGAGGRSNFDPKFVGSDCSGFVAWAYRNGLGVTLPAFTGSIYAASKPLDPKDAVPGDLIMFNMNNPDPAQQHVAIYEGNGMMIHDSSVNPDGGVEETPVWSGGEFRRVQGVNAADLSASMHPSEQTTPPSDVREGQSGYAQPAPQRDPAEVAADAARRARTDLTTSDLDLTHATRDLTQPQLGGGNEMGAGAEDTAPSMTKREA